MIKRLCLLFMAIAFMVMSSRAVTINVTVGNGGNFFSPSAFTINPGDTVRWVWVNGFHNTSAISFPAGAQTWYANITNAGESFSYVPVVSGLYRYTCTHHSGMDGQFFVTGCTYPSKPTITSANGNTTCTGDAIFLSTPVQAGVSYQWINGVTTVPFATTHALAATTSGAYKVLVNRCGVDSLSDPFPVTIHIPPVPSFSYTHSGLDYTFTNTTTPITGTDFLWSFSDGSPDQPSVNAFHTFAVPGNYIVTLRTTVATTSCFDTLSVSILANVDTTDTTDTTSGTFIEPAGMETGSCSIYPNPVVSVLHINTHTQAIVSLTDVMGHVIMVNTTNADGTQLLDVNTLPVGMYLLQVQTHAGVIRRKIIVCR